MRKENPICSIPTAVAALGEPWTALWASLPVLVSYSQICGVFNFASNKSASNIICSDPDAPTPLRVGRAALFDRTELVVWAANRAAGARRRGCQASKGGLSDEH